MTTAEAMAAESTLETIETRKYNLLDRAIDIDLYDTYGAKTSIVTPAIGLKPDMSLRVKFAAEIVTMSEVLIKNLYLPIPLNADNLGKSYKWIQIRAGYRDSMYTTFEGEVYTASQDKPGPDSVTRITFMSGAFGKLAETWVEGSYGKSTSLNSVLKDVCTRLNNKYASVSLDTFIPDSVVLPCVLHTNCTLLDFVTKIRQQFVVHIELDGNRLRVSDAKLDSPWDSAITELTNISSLKKTAAGIYVTAPWVPTLRMNDIIRVTSKHFSVENLGSASTVLGTDFKIVTLSAVFGTNSSENKMSIMALGKSLA